MALFTVFAYKRRPPASIRSLLDDLTAAAHVQPEVEVRAQLSGVRRPMHAHVIATATAVYAAEQQVHVGPDLTVVHGHPFRGVGDGGRPRALTATEASASCAGGVDLAEIDGWIGDYALCHVDPDGVLTALSDLHRVHSLYYVDTPWVFAVSTRPSLLALLAGGTGVDPTAVAAVSATGFSLGEVTMHAGVRAVPQGTALRWDGHALTFLQRDRVVVRPDQRGLDVDDPWTHGQLDAGIEQAVASIELGVAPGEDIELGITGGKDSRVVLAMCLAHGLGPRLRLFTRGPEDHPDVVSARLLAARAGVQHRVIAPPPVPESDSADPAAMAAEDFLAKLARHAFQTDGLVGGWDVFAGTCTGTGTTFSGLMGEVLKAFQKKPFAPDGHLDPAAVVDLQSPFDTIGVLTPWGRQVLVDQLDQRFVELLDAGYTHADLPDLFYYENRIPNWLGQSKQVYAFTTTQIAPLGAVPFARGAFRAAASQRKAELIPYLLIQRTAPQLLDVPFALQTWDQSLPGAPAVEPIPMPPPVWPRVVRPHGGWQYAANRPEVRRALRMLIRETEAPVVWEAVDQAALLKRLNGPRLGYRKLISLLGIVTTVMHAGDRVDHTKIVSSEASEPPTPYAMTWATPGPVWGRSGRIGGRRGGWTVL